jgi:hypothetical protein
MRTNFGSKSDEKTRLARHAHRWLDNMTMEHKECDGRE